MKNLKDVLEKLKIDDIVLDKEELPIDEPVKKWIEFLKKFNFTEIEYVDGDSNVVLIKKLNDVRGYGFYYGNMGNTNCQYIYIANTTNEDISKNNPYYYFNDKYKEFHRNGMIIPKKTFIDEFYKKFKLSY